MTEQYLEVSKKILTNKDSVFKFGSKGSGLISLYGNMAKYDLRKGFPLLTTKRVPKNMIIHELLWFLRGDTNIKYLEDNGIRIWRRDVFQHNLPEMLKKGIFPEHIGESTAKYTEDWYVALNEYGERIKESGEFAQRFGNAGPIYGAQWRRWRAVEEGGEVKEIDQIRNVIEKLRKKPFGKKYIVNSWNIGDIPDMSLPPCHYSFHVAAVEEGGELFLDLLMNQRSCDHFLGVPFNIASYAMLTQVLAQQVGMKPRNFVHITEDDHFYTGLEERSKWYGENLDELKLIIASVENRKNYLGVIDWINSNAPRDENEEQYDHVTAILEQLSRKPRNLPTLTIAEKDLDDLTFEDFKIKDYDPHPTIKRSMAV